MGAIYKGQGIRTMRQENDFGGGLNTGYSPFDINDNESAASFGWDTDLFPAKRTAKGRSLFGAAGSGVTRLLANFKNTHLVRAIGSQLQYHNGTDWTNITGTVDDADWDWTNFNDVLILVNGNQRMKWNGTQLTNLAGSPPAGAKYVTNDNVRVWMAVKDVIHFSAFQHHENWTAAENSGSVQYETPNGGDITALVEFYGDKWVFKKDSLAVIKGTNYFNFQLISVSNDIGCVNFKTIKEVGDTLFWLGETDIYAHQGGVPTAIGQKARKYVQSINRSHLDKCSAFTDGSRYYLCLVTGDATEPNVRLVYDPRYGIWEVAGLLEKYRYSVFYNTKAYVGDSEGKTWIANDSNTSDSAVWEFVTRPFDEGYPEAEKQYKELHLQGYFAEGSTLKVSVSVNDRGEDWIDLDFDPLFNGSVTQNKNCIIPLDIVPLTHWVRFKLSGTGEVELQQMQRYFKVCRVQR